VNIERKIIILVDDIKSNLDQGRSILKPFYEVYPASSASKLFTYLEKFIPDLILLDIKMPEMDGYEVIKKLKTDPRFEPIPVIFLTAKSDESSEYIGLSLGAADYVSKPFSAALLLKRIENQLMFAHRANLLRETNANLETALKMAKDATNAKSKFLAYMSHEIRTPMNAIIGMSKIAMRTDEVSKLKYCLSNIENSTVHLLGLINDILDFSKIEAGKLTLDHAPINIEKMLMRTSGFIIEKAKEKNIDFSIVLGTGMRMNYMGDELRLSQVVTNLLANAVKFTPDNGKIELTTDEIHKENGYSILRFSVKDTGIGMTEEQKERLFTAFEQAESGTARKFGGTGLGLSISKNIVEMMGGKISVESEINKGSEFIFEVRLERPEQSDAENKHEAEPERETGTPDFSGFTLLLAEDVDINRIILISLLEDTKISIDTAENGLVAVEMFKRNPEKYGMIMMDVQMPDMDGYEATKIIRSLDIESAKAVPIIALTANVFKEDIEKCIKSGMNGHLSKPIDDECVINTIKRFYNINGK